MKESKFNYFAKDGNNIICMNGMSGNVFSVSEETYNTLKQILSNPESEKYNSDLVLSLYKLHFLIDDDFDEIDHLRKRYSEAIKSDSYRLIINPTQECNFRCWYCYETHTCGHMTLETMNHVKLFLNKVLDRSDINVLDLSWFGGEPLLYFNEVVYPLSVYAREEATRKGKAFYNSMTTNGFCLTKEVIAKCKEIDLNSLQITLDGNREKHNQTRNNHGEPSFDRILGNIIDYCAYRAENHVILRVNYTAEVLDAGLKEVFANIPVEIRSQIKVSFHRVWQTVGKEKLTKRLLEHMDYVEKMNFSMINNSTYAMFYGQLCYADSVNYANINFDGNVFRCTAKEYNPQNRLGYLSEQGDIVWTEKALMDKVDATPTFENEMCLKCKNLAICGGHCFSQRWLMKKNSQKAVCVHAMQDTDVDIYLREYYKMRQKRMEELKRKVG